MAMEATCFHRLSSPKVTTEPAAGGDAETMEPWDIFETCEKICKRLHVKSP